MKRLPCLTVWPIWAYSILYDGKAGENRSWAPPKHLIGQWLLIHAGAGTVGTGTNIALRERIDTWLRFRNRLNLPPIRPRLSQELPRSCLVAAVRLSAAHAPGQGPDSPWRELGSWWWVWDRMVALYPPLYARGRQGIWWCPEAYRHDVESAVAAAEGGAHE